MQPRIAAGVALAAAVTGVRCLHAWRPAAGRAILLACALLVLLPPACRLAGIPVEPSYSAWWSIPEPWSRPAVERELRAIPGQHLVVVRYRPGHPAGQEWIYNEADIDASRIVWAREMDPARTRRLLDYFRSRHAWLLEPDVSSRPLPFPPGH